MEYILISLFQIFGVLFHAGQKINDLDKRYPEKSKKQIIGVFWDEDWNTLFFSAVVLAFTLAVHLSINIYAPSVLLLSWLGIPFMIWALGFSTLLGYAGQRIIYKFLGTAENALNKKIEAQS
jgi:hypothetical protein